MNYNVKKSGFTLVEVSIVLIVIGLLAGGIIASQSIIESAKITSEIRNITQFDSAVASFYSRYGQLPGDTNRVGLTSGNTNGYIDGVESYNSETRKFWSDLVDTGFSAQAFDSINFSASSGYNGGLVPTSAINESAGIVAMGVEGDGNYYLFSNFTDAVTLQMAPAFEPIHVLSVDQKIDDAVANTGEVIATDAVEADPSIITTPTVGTNCTTVANGGEYNLAQGSEACSMAVRMGITSGELF